MKKNICILYTGGTIGMLPTKNGYAPKRKWLTEQLKNLHIFQQESIPKFDIIEYENLIDSSNSKPENWISIAKDIIKYYDYYDAFIVLHGTDTLAYTASALSFMLDNLSKPVICTGSQIPLSQIRSDAVDNILDSLLIAAYYAVPEVCVYFGKLLLRGNRSQKISATALQAFQSPNLPPLGNVGIDIKLNSHLLLKKSSEKIYLNIIKNPKIAEINIFPGINYKVVEDILKSPLDGLVLKTYGSGNIPNDQNLLNTLKDASQKGTIIVNCTQCQRGSVDMTKYETGSILLENGIISGKDMTDESALTKLYVLCSKGYENNTIRKLMCKNLKGELTE